MVFLAYPIFKAFAGSMHDWNPMTGVYEWNGLENFKTILSDPLFWQSIWNTFFGIHVNWLQDPKWAMPAIIIMTAWKDFGYATVLYMAALINIPKDILEAAQIDGADSWQKFWNITLPLIRPTTVFVFITSLITYFQAYVQILMMTDGGPGTKTYTISYLIYSRAFVNYDFGTASAMSVILFLITGILSFLSLRVSSEKD